jgi:hypothetical protein
VEYHEVSKKEARWDRSIERFKGDLERYYRMGFRPVTLSAYLDNKMDLAPGASPMVFTFDDSRPSQFRLRDDGTLDPDCALGIWQEFAKTHPDFPILATFFILPDTGPWGQRNLVDKKLAMLKDLGCELGSHTLSHPNLSKLTDAQVEKELSGAADFIESKGFICDTIALPFGISPKNKALLKGFDQDGKHYAHRAALLVGANPAPAPTSEKLNPMRLPRIQSVELDMGITYWLDKIEKGDTQVYVQP